MGLQVGDTRDSFLLAVCVASLALQLACSSSEFSSCESTYTCASSGSGGTAGTDSSAGSSGTANGGSSGAGGTTGGTSGATTGGNSGTGDTTPPTVVSILPADLAKGVIATAPIIITFSETMNTASASQAVQLSTFASSDVTMSWDATGQILTVTPSGGLSYATGSALATTTALTYTVTVGNGATDLAGNALAPFTSSFTTLRKVSQVIPSDAAGGDNTYGHALGNSPSICPTVDPLSVSSFSNNNGSGQGYVFIPFNIAALGDPSQIASILSATLDGTQSAPTGDPYAVGLVKMEKVQYQAIDKTVLAATVTDNLSTFANSALAQPSASVLAALKSDLAIGTQQELYRLAPTFTVSTTNTTLAANFTCSGFSLNVVFLEP